VLREGSGGVSGSGGGGRATWKSRYSISCGRCVQKDRSGRGTGDEEERFLYIWQSVMDEDRRRANEQHESVLWPNARLEASTKGGF
jgi:hypothetical protein